MTQPGPPRPVEAVAQRVRELRTDRGWSRRKLGEELTEAGLEWDRDIVTNFELGRRRTLSVDEFLILAFVLDIAPVHLLVPPYPQRGSEGWRPDGPDDSAPYQVTPKLLASCHEVRQFVRAYEPLPGQDPWKFYEQRPPHERIPPEELKRRAAAAAQRAHARNGDGAD